MIGKYPAKLDEKNRLIVPAKLRGELGDEFYVTLGVNCRRSCLTVYKAEDWKKLEENYSNLPISQRADATSLIVGRAGQAEIWDAEAFAAFEAENLTPDKLLASLEAIGL